MDGGSAQRTSRISAGRKIQLGSLFAIDILVIVLLIWCTTTKLLTVGRYTVELDDKFVKKGSLKPAVIKEIERARSRVLYAMYAGIVVFGLSTSLYTVVSLRSQTSPDTNDIYADDPSTKGKDPRNPLVVYLYLTGYAFAWALTILGFIIVYYDESTYRLEGKYTITAERGASALAAGWLILTLAGIWRLVVGLNRKRKYRQARREAVS